jgi:hypothetical protein
MSKRKKISILDELSQAMKNPSSGVSVRKVDEEERRAKKAAKNALRITFYLPDEIREYVKVYSVKWGVPMSQVAQYLLEYAIEHHEAGSIPPPALVPSNSPAYRNAIDFDAAHDDLG